MNHQREGPVRAKEICRIGFDRVRFDFLKKTPLATGVIALSIGAATSAFAHHVPVDVPKAPQTNPIQLGTSGSSKEFLRIKNLLYCYAGTLGALVSDGEIYVLSNNHVIAKENEELNRGTDYDPLIVQPALLDDPEGCTLASRDSLAHVATLSRYVPILFGKGRNLPTNHVDGALARVDNAAAFDAGGRILGIGTLGGGLQTAVIGDPVQKTGRTTAHTFGTIVAVNVQVDVRYESGTARFADQIRIRHARYDCEGTSFSAGGDSGSLIVSVPEENSATGARAVGLLFAGSSSDTIANPMWRVLESLKVDMVSSSRPETEQEATMSHYSPCSASGGGGGGGGKGGGRPGQRAAANPQGLQVAQEVQARNSAAIFALPDVVGHGIGRAADDRAVIEIYVATPAGRAGSYPSHIEGVPVRVIETGEFRAF
jgi:hypothetical protein